MAGLLESVKQSATYAKWVCLQKGMYAVLFFQRSRYFSPSTQPDDIKAYASREDLYPCRIFYPASRKPDAQLPLLILVHGGGFIVNNPSRDDPMARYLADAARCVVVSIDYRKSPQQVFPQAYEDVVEVSCAVIEATDLPIDREHVYLGGISAGGNLVLAAVQDKRLRSRVSGVIGLYPVCDGVATIEEKMASRPDSTVPDILESSYEDILKLYVGNQAPLDDIRVSPTRFGKRDDLPENVYLIGVEHDLLCAEAKSMAEKLAIGLPRQETAYGWQAEGVKWDCVAGQTHGFDQFGMKGQDESKRLAQTQETYQAIADWLLSTCGAK